MIAPSTPRLCTLDPSLYPAGIGVWGALPAVYDTTTFPPEHGVHVHARVEVGRKKEIDESFDTVEVVLPSGTVTIREVAATAYVAAAVLNLPVSSISCPYCEQPHLDEGHFAIHPHQRHHCSTCDEEFLLGERAVGNPVMIAKRQLGDEFLNRPTIPGKRRVRIDQTEDFCSGGILIWGSNPAILWTASRSEQAGIHVHAFRKGVILPTIDDTYEQVEIDGFILDAAMIRMFMIQQSLDHLRGLICNLVCDKCGGSHFDDKAPFAVEPHRNHPCTACGHVIVTSSAVISNPVIDLLPKLYANASQAGLPKNPLAR